MFGRPESLQEVDSTVGVGTEQEFLGCTYGNLLVDSFLNTTLFCGREAYELRTLKKSQNVIMLRVCLPEIKISVGSLI